MFFFLVVRCVYTARSKLASWFGFEFEIVGTSVYFNAHLIVRIIRNETIQTKVIIASTVIQTTKTTLLLAYLCT